MAFDFQAAVAAAQQVVEKKESGGSGGTYRYPLVYPQSGSSITIRPLFNPKSGQIVRLVQRHEKTACLKTYGTECPICKIQQQVKDMTGQDPFGRTSASKSRGICFAQFISASYQLTKGDNGGVIQPGEIILFMFPWSVYSQLNTIIQATSQTPTGMDMAFSHASSGMFIQVSVTKDFKYTTTNVPFMTFPTNQTDDDFIKMLDEMDSLADQVLPSTITEDVSKQVNEYVESINRQFIVPRLASQAPYQAQMQTFSNPVPSPATTQASTSSYTQYSQVPAGVPAMNSQYTAPSAPQVPSPVANPQYAAPPIVPQTAPSADGMPECFGRHQASDTKCICCPCEVQCIEKTGEPF